MLPPALAQGIELGANDRIVVGVIAVVALAALAIGFILRREVLAADEGTPKMQEIGRAVQEGAVAYLNRQFRTLGVFVIVVFVLLFALPADDIGERIGRSIFFIIGAVFSATIGSLGMRLATAANIRVASAAREQGGREKATRIAFRTGGVVGMFTVGLGLFGRVDRRAGLRGPGPEGAGGLRLRRRAAGHVHEGRRRHLHQGRRRRRRPGRQGRAGHPGGRPAQRRHHRRQRRRQRRRLRRHGRRPVRVLRGHPGRRADPGLGRVRRAGPAVPADRAGHRRAHRGDRRLHHPDPGGRGQPQDDQPELLHLRRDLGGALRDRRVPVPAGHVRRPAQPERHQRRRRHGRRRPAQHRHRRGDHRHRAAGGHPAG